MPRKRWGVTSENFSAAWSYLYRNRPDLQLVLKAIDTPENLQALIKEDLSPDEVQKLRTSLRVDKARHKKLMLDRKDVQITISPKAHQALAQFSQSRDITLSEALDRYIGTLSNMPYDEVEKLADEWGDS